MNRLAAALAYKPQTSWCQHCRQDKSISDFAPRSPWCRSCTAISQRGLRQRYPEAVRHADAAWRRRNPEKALAGRMRRLAMLRKAGNPITKAERRLLVSLAQGRCLCCNMPGRLVFDHVIPLAAGGRNQIDNIQPLCRRCNARKGTGTTDYRSDYFKARIVQE